MSVLLRNNFKLVKLLRLRGVRKILPNIYYLHLSNPYTGLRTNTGSFATAALKINNEYRNSESKIAQEEENVNKALLEVDFLVRRTGRTALYRINEIFQMIENNGFATEKQSLFMLRCCGLLHLETPAKRIELVNKMCNKFETLGVPLNIKHYNALLKVYLSCKHNFSPSEFLVLMERHSIEPDQITYTYLIDKYCQDGDLNGASEVLEFMKEKGIPVNEAVFNSLIKGHMKMNDISGAKEIMDVMRKSNISPTSVSYTILACGFAEKGMFDKIEETISEAEKYALLLQTDSFLEIILSMAPAGHAEYADKLLSKIEDLHEWRQEIINTASELIHVGADQLSYKFIMAISNADYSGPTNTFIKTLVKSNTPVERILNYATEIFEKNINPFILINASKVCMESGNLDCAVAIFTEMQKRGIPVRCRNFKPFFAAYKNSPEGIWKIMKNMSILGIPLDFATWEENVLPAVAEEAPEKIISKIQESGQSVELALDCLFQHYCLCGDIKNAFTLTENHQINVKASFNIEQFLTHYRKFSRNPTIYFKVLKYILENALLSGADTSIYQGNQLASILLKDPNVFEAFHKSSIGQTCSYYRRSIEICKNIIMKTNPTLLGKLNVFKKDYPSSKPLKEISIESEEEVLNSSFADNPQKQSQLMEMLSIHLQNQDYERIKKVKKELDSLQFILPPNLLSRVFFIHCELGDVDAARETFQTIKENYPTYKIDSAKLFDYARLLLRFSKTDECVDLIKNECQEINTFTGTYVLIRSLRRFVNNVVQTGNIQFATAIQTALIVHTNEPEIKEIILEPLLKIYLFRKDLDNCLKEANNCVINYKCLPCLGTLLKKFIQTEDQSRLQTLVDLASKLESKSKILHKLALAFIEMGRLAQASKALQDLGRNIDFNFLEEECKEYYNQKWASHIESLLYATSGLINGQKEIWCNRLFKLLAEKNDYKKCVEILNLMKKENIDPSSDSEKILNRVFLKNGKTIPFPSDDKNTDSETTIDLSSKNKEISKFSDFLKQGHVEAALEELDKLKKGYVRLIPFQEMSTLVDKLIEKKSLKAVESNINLMSYMIENSPSILKPLLAKYSESGDVEAMTELASVFPDFSLKKCFYNSYLGRTYIASDRHEDLLELLESYIDKKNKFFSLVAFEELVKIPHLEDRVIELGKKYVQNNFDLPLAAIWSHYFTSERYEKAKEISKIGPIPVGSVDARVLKCIQQTGNFEMGKRYIELVSQLNVRDRNQERAYGTLLDLYVLKEMHDDAVNLVLEAKSKNIDLGKHYQSTLSTLKSALERENKSVPFHLVGEAAIS